MRFSFDINTLAAIKRKLLMWSGNYDNFCYLDSNEYGEGLHGEFECLLGVGIVDEIVVSPHQEKNAFEALREFNKERKSWLLGYLSYDLKNDVEDLSSENFDGIGLPSLHFFEPEIFIKLSFDAIEIYSKSKSVSEIWKEIQDTSSHIPKPNPIDLSLLQSRISKSDYVESINKIKHHLHIGDIYEMNFCQEFFIENITIPPLALFNRLNTISEAPFSSFYKIGEKYLLSASPERFLKKQGQELISQPIKGTIKKGKTIAENQAYIEQLKNSQKDRSENVMIVDLVRNDLARTCIPGTVKVSELFGVYPFKHVNHLISTITGTLKPKKDLIDAIKEAFPMGSMTGAPKIRSMELIEKYEKTKRGLYSGAVGYITPDNDFDFNVVIRSMIYNAASKYLSFQVGGAIVYDSSAEGEYEECLLKAKGILQALGN